MLYAAALHSTVTPVNLGAEIVPGGTLYTWAAAVIAPAGSISGGSAQGTGQASISQTLTNTTNASATATYTVTPVSGACTGATFTITVTVNPKATIANKTATICSGNAFTVTPVNGGAGNCSGGTIIYLDSTGHCSGRGDNGWRCTGDRAAKYKPDTYKYDKCFCYGNLYSNACFRKCAGATFQIQVTVSPKATISDKTTTICSGTAFSITPVNGELR